MDAISSLPPDAALIVDQCEEVVLLCDDPAEQTRFLTVLAERSERSDVVVAVRADRLGDLSAVPAFARMVQRGFVLLGAHARGRSAGVDRRARSPGRPAPGARPRQPARPRGRGRAGSAAAALPRPAPHVGAARGAHAHRRRLHVDGRHQGRRRPVGRGGLRGDHTGTASDPAGHAPQAGGRRTRRRADPGPRPAAQPRDRRGSTRICSNG